MCEIGPLYLTVYKYMLTE